MNSFCFSDPCCCWCQYFAFLLIHFWQKWQTQLSWFCLSWDLLSSLYFTRHSTSSKPQKVGTASQCCCRSLPFSVSFEVSQSFYSVLCCSMPDLFHFFEAIDRQFSRCFGMMACWKYYRSVDSLYYFSKDFLSNLHLNLLSLQIISLCQLQTTLRVLVELISYSTFLLQFI